MNSAYPIRGRPFQPTHSPSLPPLPPLSPDAGDQLPKHATPNEVSHVDEPQYKPYRSGQFPLIMSVPNTTQPLPQGVPPSQQPTSWATPKWNPVTGFKEMQPAKSYEIPQHDTPRSSTTPPRRGMTKDVDIETFPPRTYPYPNGELGYCSVVSQGSSSQEESHSHEASYDPTGNTPHNSLVGEEISLPASTLGLQRRRSAGLANTRSGLMELSDTEKEIKKLIGEAGVMECRLSAALISISNQRGRNECLEEVCKSLYGRASAKHIGVAERRILRREADTIYNLTRTKEWKEQVDVQVGNVREKFTAMLASISRAVDDLYEKAAAVAVEMAVVRTDAMGR